MIETPFYLIWRAKYLKNIEYVLIFSVLFNILLLFIIYLQRNRLLRFMPKYNVDKYHLTTRHRDIKKVLSCDRKLIKSVDNLDGIQFERLCCEILHKQGYIDIAASVFLLDIAISQQGHQDTIIQVAGRCDRPCCSFACDCFLERILDNIFTDTKVSHVIDGILAKE